jgi:hypothetical protein
MALMTGTRKARVLPTQSGDGQRVTVTVSERNGYGVRE